MKEMEAKTENRYEYRKPQERSRRQGCEPLGASEILSEKS